jgi:hypothetical protein
MIVIVGRDRVEVEDPDDCSRLHVAAHAVQGEVSAQLTTHGLGTVEPTGGALLDVAALRALAGRTASAADWPDRWDRMVAYAHRKGWTSADGRFLRAHVEVHA